MTFPGIIHTSFLERSWPQNYLFAYVVNTVFWLNMNSFRILVNNALFVNNIFHFYSICLVCTVFRTDKEEMNMRKCELFYMQKDKGGKFDSASLSLALFSTVWRGSFSAYMRNFLQRSKNLKTCKMSTHSLTLRKFYSTFLHYLLCLLSFFGKKILVNGFLIWSKNVTFLISFCSNFAW